MNSLRASEFAAIRQLVHAQSGVVIESDKGYLVEARLGPLLREQDVQSVTELLERVPSDASGALRRTIVQCLVNGETTFFRDPLVFEMLRHQLLPKLIAARQAQRRIVIWSAACSTGQEPYSVAMLLHECFPELAAWKVQILATDFSEEHLARARAGRYSQFEVNRGLPAAMLVRWFEKQGDEWLIHPALRERIEFVPINLVTDQPPVFPLDLVLLRNVMIYWDLPTKRSVLGSVRELLAPDGALVLGAAETTLQIDDSFERVSSGGASYFALTQR